MREEWELRRQKLGRFALFGELLVFYLFLFIRFDVKVERSTRPWHSEHT